MKNILGFLNMSFIVLLAVYVMTTKDINTLAYDKCVELDKKIGLQDERYNLINEQLNNLSEIATQKDTIVINIKNYNYHNK